MENQFVEVLSSSSFFIYVQVNIVKNFTVESLEDTYYNYKVNFFAWGCFMGKIFDLGSTQKLLEVVSMCYLCKGDEEIANHIALHSSKEIVLSS